MNKVKEKKRILDASALINTDTLTEKEAHTTPSVIEELKTLDSKSLAEAAKTKGKLKVEKPTEKYLKKVKEKAKEVGSLRKLSQTDLEVLALTLQKKGEVNTDDYTMQNLAAHLELNYRGVSRGKIKRKRKFKKNQ